MEAKFFATTHYGNAHLHNVARAFIMPTSPLLSGLSKKTAFQVFKFHYHMLRILGKAQVTDDRMKCIERYILHYRKVLVLDL